MESKRSFTCRNYEGESKLKKFKTWIWETLVGSIANEKHNSCHELLLQRIHECNDLRQQAIELQQEKNAAVKAVQELIKQVDTWRDEQRISENTIKNYERVVREMSILLEQHKNQSFVFYGCVEELENRYPRLFSNATTPKTTN